MSAFEQAGVSKRELFQENMIDIVTSIHDPSLDAHNPDTAIDPNETAKRRAAQAAQDVHDGTISGSVDGVRGGIAERVADNRDSKEARAARESKKADDTMFYLGLAQDYNSGLAIARGMYEGMSDQEVFDFSERMEAETGKSIHVWAEEILTDDQRKRLPDETDAEYERRIQQETIAAMLGPDGEFLPEYADHPLARWVQQQEEHQASVERVREREAAIVADPSQKQEVVAAVSKEVAEDQITADAYAQYSEIDALKITGNDGHDGFRDKDFSTAEAVERGASVLGRFSTTSDTLAAASKDVNEQFAKASTDETKVQQHDVKVDFDNRMT